MKLFPLSELKPYAFARVERIEDGAPPRLDGLGITPGAELVWLFTAPGGDPTAYSVRGTVVALRRSDAERIIVRGCGDWV